MNAILLAVLLSQAVDSPLKDSTPAIPRPALVLKAGDPMPWDGLALDDAQAVAQAKKGAACQAELAAAKENHLISTPQLVAAAGIIVAVVGAAFGAGYVAGHVK